jgi:hypothetical protein
MPTAVVGTKEVRAVVLRALEKGNGSSKWLRSSYVGKMTEGSALVDVLFKNLGKADGTGDKGKA